MPDSYTPVFGFTLPEVGASRDSWGAKLSSNFSMIDQLMSFFPIGLIGDYAGGTAPSGWLVCDGRLLSRTTYSDLFTVLGTTWGAGDGSTTFALPNSPGRALVGPGTVIDELGNSVTYSYGQKTGNVQQAITMANLPAATITTSTIAAHAHGGATGLGANHTHGATDVQGDHGHSGYTDTQGFHGHGVADPGHAHGYSAPQVNTPASQMTAGFGFSVTGAGATTSVSGTGIGIYGDGNHAHNVATYNAGAHAHNVPYSGNLQLPINADGAHAHTFPLGSGTLFAVIQPILVCTKIIFAGRQAVTTLMSLSSTTESVGLMMAPMRGAR